MSGSPSSTADAAVSRPVADEDSAAYWSALRDHRILLQRCTACGETRAPRMPGCPQCGSDGFDDVEVRGTGKVYSWIVIHHPLGGLTAEQLPRTIATVELDEGCRILGRLVAGAGDDIGVRADLPVQPVFFDHDGWTELAFTPTGQH